MFDADKCSSKRFFEWFYQNITCPTVKQIRECYNPSATPATDGGDIPADQKFVLWGDSAIPYLQQIMTPSRIIAAMLLGLYFAKFGAKITESTQPLDMGPFLKILRLNGKNMTSIDTVKPLTILVDMIFKDLRAKKELLLPPLKEAALKDLLVTAPELMNSVFSEKVWLTLLYLHGC